MTELAKHATSDTNGSKGLPILNTHFYPAINRVPTQRTEANFMLFRTINPTKSWPIPVSFTVC